MSFKEKLNIKNERMKLHDRQLQRYFLQKEHMDKNSIEFHRHSRVELYKKVEALITA